MPSHVIICCISKNRAGVAVLYAFSVGERCEIVPGVRCVANPLLWRPLFLTADELTTLASPTVSPPMALVLFIIIGNLNAECWLTTTLLVFVQRKKWNVSDFDVKQTIDTCRFQGGVRYVTLMGEIYRAPPNQNNVVISPLLKTCVIYSILIQ